MIIEHLKECVQQICNASMWRPGAMWIVFVSIQYIIIYIYIYVYIIYCLFLPVITLRS